MAKLTVAGFDYANATRGYWARLRDGGGREVLLTEYPGTLLAMFRAGVLVGEAKVDAESATESAAKKPLAKDPVPAVESVPL